MAKVISLLGGLLMLVAVAGIGWGMMNTQSVEADVEMRSVRPGGTEARSPTGAKFVSAPAAETPSEEVAMTAESPRDTLNAPAASPNMRERAAAAIAAAMAAQAGAQTGGAVEDTSAFGPDTNEAPDLGELMASARDVQSSLDRLQAQKSVPLSGAINALSDRCWESVVFHKPFDASGLEDVSEERIDYAEPYSRQSWRDPETGLVAVYEMSGARGDASPLRTCQVKTDWRGDDQAAEIDSFADNFDDWFEARGLAGSFAPYAQETHVNQHAKLSRHGSAGGCQVLVHFFHRELMSMEMRFEVREFEGALCDAQPFAAPGEVKVNQLVQVNR